ncbi:MAG: molybdopterin-dependent oxidoreductase [Bacteroidales bacterium]|nr:molybdopterin-dependent oxidoreductase [Bacteroidales bacterium]
MARSEQLNQESIHSTACPRNCYSTCSLKVRVSEGKIVGIDPHTANLATPEGPCIKGLAYVERASSPDRILYPMKRNGIGNGNGSFIRISWDEALDLITDKLNLYRNNFGSHSVLFYASSGMSGLLNGVSTNFWKLFGGATTTYGNLCWPAGLEATRLTLGANKHNVPWDLENARLILLWGKNPAESNIQEMIPLDRSLDKGGQLVVIDPRRTSSSERAGILAQIKPGTDGALALGIARELIKNDWLDHEFIDNHVLGFDTFAESVDSFTPDYVEKICRIPKDGIIELARLIGTVKPMTIIPGFGLQRYENGGQTIRCILALQVITGNIGKPGACWHYANLQSYVFDDVKEPESYYPGSEDSCFRRKVSMAKLGHDILSLSNPEIKMIWVERGNPLTQNPDSGNNLKAFRNAEFRVVVEQFMTDTAREADVILPAKNMFEQSDIIGSYWNPYVQLKQKLVEPAGEVKPETEIYYLLANRLGFDPEEIKKHIPEPNDQAIEEYLQKFLNQYPELSFEELRKGPQIANCHEEIAFEDRQFPTPSGKIELFSQKAADLWGVSNLPTYDPIKEATKKYPLQLLSPNSKNRIHSQFGNLRMIRQFEPEALLFVHPDDAIARGISDKEVVGIFNDKGQSEVKVSFDMGIRRGCVVLTNGHWHSEGASANIFTTGRETDMGHGTAFHDTWLNINKL